MARRGKTSPAEGVMDIMAMLSRWGGAKVDHSAYNAATAQFPTRLLSALLRFGQAGRL